MGAFFLPAVQAFSSRQLETGSVDCFEVLPTTGRQPQRICEFLRSEVQGNGQRISQKENKTTKQNKKCENEIRCRGKNKIIGTEK